MNFDDVLFPVDLEHSSSWEKALPIAIDATTENGTLHVLTVVPDFGMSIVSQYFPEGYRRKVAEAVLERLHAFTGEHVPKGVTVQHVVGEGSTYDTILRVAGESDVGLVVMAAHRPEASGYLLGPNAARVVRHARCSVLVVR